MGDPHNKNRSVRVQDEAAVCAWQMLNEWRDIASQLEGSPQQCPLDAQTVAAVCPKHLQPPMSPAALVTAFANGWRPLVPEERIASLATVPWLRDLEQFVAELGAALEFTSSGVTVHKVHLRPDALSPRSSCAGIEKCSVLLSLFRGWLHRKLVVSERCGTFAAALCNARF
jgi:hypothetical protein